MIEILSGILSETICSEIETFINANEPNCFFHNTLTYKILKNTKGSKPYYLIHREDREINGLALVNVMTSYKAGFMGKRAVMHHYPIITGKNNELNATQFLKYLKNGFAPKVLYFELRSLTTGNKNATLFESNGFIKRDRINLILYLDNINLFDKLNESKRRQVRKAQKAGLETTAAASLSEVNDFYRILKKHYRHRVRKPLPPASFFHSVYRYGGKQIQLLVTKTGNTVIGGVVLAGTPGNTYYEWYIAGNDHNYKHLYPSVFSTWRAIEIAAEQKGTKFDFMGGGIPGVPYGVRDFKEKFGSLREKNIRLLYTAHPLFFSLIKNMFKWLGI